MNYGKRPDKPKFSNKNGYWKTLLLLGSSNVMSCYSVPILRRARKICCAKKKK